MSVSEIVTELLKLNRPELEAVDAKVHELLGRKGDQPHNHWGQALAELAGTAEGLPEDYALNHDHYLYGAAKR